MTLVAELAAPTNKLQAEWLPGLVKPDGAACYTFTKIAGSNCRRSYQIIYQCGLWSDYSIERTWGRLGSARQRTKSHLFENEDEALAFLKRLVTNRLKRGYILYSFIS